MTVCERVAGQQGPDLVSSVHSAAVDGVSFGSL